MLPDLINFVQGSLPMDHKVSGSWLLCLFANAWFYPRSAKLCNFMNDSISITCTLTILL